MAGHFFLINAHQTVYTGRVEKTQVLLAFNVQSPESLKVCEAEFLAHFLNLMFPLNMFSCTNQNIRKV